jgi:hypothetical protein
MVKCAQLYTGWLDNVSSIMQAHFSLLLSSYCSAGFGPFLQAPIILPIGWKISRRYANGREKLPM